MNTLQRLLLLIVTRRNRIFLMKLLFHESFYSFFDCFLFVQDIHLERFFVCVHVFVFVRRRYYTIRIRFIVFVTPSNRSRNQTHCRRARFNRQSSSVVRPFSGVVRRRFSRKFVLPWRPCKNDLKTESPRVPFLYRSAVWVVIRWAFLCSPFHFDGRPRDFDRRARTVRVWVGHGRIITRPQTRTADSRHPVSREQYGYLDK